MWGHCNKERKDLLPRMCILWRAQWGHKIYVVMCGVRCRTYRITTGMIPPRSVDIPLWSFKSNHSAIVLTHLTLTLQWSNTILGGSQYLHLFINPLFYCRLPYTNIPSYHFTSQIVPTSSWPHSGSRVPLYRVSYIEMSVFKWFWGVEGSKILLNFLWRHVQ